MFRPALAIPCIPLALSFACSGSDDEVTTKSSAVDDTNGETSANPSDTGDEPTTTMGTPSGAPVVMELLANTNTISESEPITFTATVVDGDGLDTIVGGKLTTEDGTGFYGAFAHIGGGTYQIVLTWDLIGQTAKIEFKGASNVRVFQADFVDVDGNHGTKTIEIILTCATGAACNSDCIDLTEDNYNCGQCGETCQYYESCIDGLCDYGF